MSLNIFINQNMPKTNSSPLSDTFQSSVVFKALATLRDPDYSLSQLISSDTITKINKLLNKYGYIENAETGKIVHYAYPEKIKKIFTALACEVLNLDEIVEVVEEEIVVKEIGSNTIESLLKIAANTPIQYFNLNQDTTVEDFSIFVTEREQILPLIPKVYTRTSFQTYSDTEVDVVSTGCYKDEANIRSEFSKVLNRTLSELGYTDNEKRDTFLQIWKRVWNGTWLPNVNTVLVSDSPDNPNFFLKINDESAGIEKYLAQANFIYNFKPGMLDYMENRIPDGYSVTDSDLANCNYFNIYNGAIAWLKDTTVKPEQYKPNDDILAVQKFLILIFKNLKYGTINYK